MFLSLLRLSQFIDAAVPPQHGGTAAQLLKLLPALLCCCAGAALPRRLLAIDAAALPLRRDPLRVIPARVIMGDSSRFSPARVSVGAVRIMCRTTDGSRALSSTPEVARQPAAATALFLSLLRLSQFIDAAVPPQHGGAAAQLLKLLPALLCCCAGAVLPRRMLATGAAALPRRRDPSRVIPARVIMKDPSRVSPARVGVGVVRIVRHTTDGSRALSSTPEAARQPAPLTPPRASGRSGLPGQAIARAKRTGGPSGAWASRRGIASSSSEETGPRGTLNRRRAHQWVFPSEPIARLGAHRPIRNHPFSPTIPASLFRGSELKTPSPASRGVAGVEVG